MRLEGTSSSRSAAAGGVLADAEDHEFGRFERSDADDADQPAVVEVGLGHGGHVAADEEGFGGRGPEQPALAPLIVEKVADGGAHRAPERLAVRFEHHPAGRIGERMLEIEEIAADVDVLPLRIAGQGACASDTEAAPREFPQAVDAE